MFSIVLAMALTGGAETPAFGGRNCSGCSGWAACSGCSGSSCSGAWAGCSSSCKGSKHCGGGFFSKRCSGCCGGGWASCNGCSGGFFGKHRKSCHGCSSCSGCHTCSGTVIHACSGSCSGTIVTPKAEEIKKMPEPAKKTSLAPATIVVSLPADAKLSIDGAATTSTTAVRTFESPALEAGADHFYTLQAEIVREGKTVSATKRIAVRAGEETRVSLELPPATTVAQK